MPRLSILVPPIPFMTPSMIFSSKVLSSSSSWAQAAPVVMTRPTPRATSENRKPRVSARGEICTIQPLASASRIVFFLFILFAKLFSQRRARAQSRRNAHLTNNLNSEGPYQPGSGRFCGGNPQQGIIQQGRNASNNRHVGKVKHVPIEGISPDLDVEQGKIDHRAIGEAVNGVADGAADDQAQRHGGHQGARTRH